MKRLLLFAVFLTLITTFTTHSQNVNIPDPVFKNFLVNHSYYNPLNYYIQTYLDANNDGEIQYSEAVSYMATYENSSFNGFNLTGLDISDLTGIEAFKGIKWLTTTGLPITSLDVSGCTSLKSLNCNNNLFPSLFGKSWFEWS